jgi:hypothetical protein
MATISSIAERINQAAHGYEFGNLQEMRRRLKSKTRVPMTIFNTANKSVNDQQGWACHTGGREELQFNIGVETAGMLRFGVAFSLETSRSMHHIELFYPKSSDSTNTCAYVQHNISANMCRCRLCCHGS